MYVCVCIKKIIKYKCSYIDDIFGCLLSPHLSYVAEESNGFYVFRLWDWLDGRKKKQAEIANDRYHTS